jgi:hypothetical protein
VFVSSAGKSTLPLERLAELAVSARKERVSE